MVQIWNPFGHIILVNLIYYLHYQYFKVLNSLKNKFENKCTKYGFILKVINLKIDKEINIEATSIGKPAFDNISTLSPSGVNPYYRNYNFFQSTTPIDFSQISEKKSAVSSPRARSPSN